MKTTVWCTPAVLLAMLVVIGCAAVARAMDGQPTPDQTGHGRKPFVVEVGPVVGAPAEAGKWGAWREGLNAERKKMRERLHYDGGAYRNPAFAWVPACYCCCFAMMCDQRLYDPAGRRYTIDAFLDEGAGEFGGYDAVVLWQAYPRIGFDDRNQFDFYRDVPGGLAGLRELSRTMHERGVRVFIDYNPWDTGTRREGKSDVEMLVEMVAYSSTRCTRECRSYAAGWTPYARAWFWSRS